MAEDEPSPSVVDRVAKAIYNSHVEQLLTRVTARAFDCERAKTFFESCKSETDRAVPVLVFAYIDQTVKELFEAELNQKIPGGLAPLFEGFGPLATASARIRMLEALDWISPSTAADLHNLRRIRNQFAHVALHEGFADGAITELCNKLNPRERAIYALPDWQQADPSKIRLRDCFMIRSVLTYVSMVQELMSAPTATRMGLSPGTVVSRGYDKLPSNLKEVARMGARVVIEVIASSLLDAMTNASDANQVQPE